MKYQLCHCGLRWESKITSRSVCHKCATDPGLEYSFLGEWTQKEKALIQAAIKDALSTINTRKLVKKEL